MFCFCCSIEHTRKNPQEPPIFQTTIYNNNNVRMIYVVSPLCYYVDGKFVLLIDELVHTLLHAYCRRTFDQDCLRYDPMLSLSRVVSLSRQPKPATKSKPARACGRGPPIILPPASSNHDEASLPVAGRKSFFSSQLQVKIGTQRDERSARTACCCCC